jgi:hypothetical protein
MIGWPSARLAAWTRGLVVISFPPPAGHPKRKVIGLSGYAANDFSLKNVKTAMGIKKMKPNLSHCFLFIFILLEHVLKITYLQEGQRRCQSIKIPIFGQLENRGHRANLRNSPQFLE